MVEAKEGHMMSRPDATHEMQRLSREDRRALATGRRRRTWGDLACDATMLSCALAAVAIGVIAVVRGGL